MEPPVRQQIADQLVDEVMLRLSRVGALLPGLDHNLDRHCRQMRAAATDLADQLAVEGPTARTVAATIYSVMWAVDDAPRASWWQTPLGRAFRQAGGTPDHSDAGSTHPGTGSIFEEITGMVGAASQRSDGGQRG